MFWILGSVLGSGKCFGFWKVFRVVGSVFEFWEVFWHSTKCFGILGSVLDSGKCFVPMGHRTPHPSQHKRSVARTLFDRAKNIPSTDADKLSEVQHVVNALKINGYTNQFIKSCKSTTVSSNRFQTNRGFVTLPYLQGISEKIAQTLSHFNINVAHKLVMTAPF